MTSPTKTSLISGVTGQDGSSLAEPPPAKGCGQPQYHACAGGIGTLRLYLASTAGLLAGFQACDPHE